MFIHWFLKTKNRNKPNSKYQIFMFGYSVSIPPLRNNITPEIISYLDRDFFSSKNMLCQLDHGIVAFTNGLFEVIKASHLVLGDSHSTLEMKKHSLIKIYQWTRYDDDDFQHFASIGRILLIQNCCHIKYNI